MFGFKHEDLAVYESSPGHCVDEVSTNPRPSYQSRSLNDLFCSQQKKIILLKVLTWHSGPQRTMASKCQI